MIRIGRFEIHRIEELVLREHNSLFPDWNGDRVEPIRDWLVGEYYDPADGSFAASIHSWLVKSPEMTILIDTGSGNAKPRPLSPRFGNLDIPYLERLEAAGVKPEDVDYVLLTHLHVDHIGWNTIRKDGHWAPTFPNATYVMTRIEREARDPLMGASGRPEGATLPFVDSVQPVLDFARVELVNGDEQAFLPGIDFIRTPGHAAGQMAIRLSDNGEEALFIADVMHQPIQVSNPEWSSKYCEDPALARETRENILAYAARTGCLILPAHFGGTHCGYVSQTDEGYAYRPSAIAP